MKISDEQLANFTLEVADETYGTSTFQRRPLMLAVEARLKEIALWTIDDDAISSSRGRKSVGLAKIDWAISHLNEKGRLLNVSFNHWKIP